MKPDTPLRTEALEKFCQLMADGTDKFEALKEAYPNKADKHKHKYVKELLEKHDVQERIKQIKERLADAANPAECTTTVDVIRSIIEIRTKSMESIKPVIDKEGNYHGEEWDPRHGANALKCNELLLRYLGELDPKSGTRDRSKTVEQLIREARGKK